MTISSTVRIAGPYIGSGAATVFPFAFKVFAAAEMQVAKLNTTSNVEIILVLNTDYTVQLNGDQNGTPGGTITLPAVLASGYNLTITSDIANLQPTDLTNQGGFYPEVITDALDRATIQIQQLDQNSRAIKIPLSDGVLDMTTPVVAERASKYLAFDAAGLPVVSAGTGSDSALRTDLANATAVSAGSRLSGFRQTGTGATARTVDAKLKDTLSVKDFGAVGDNVTDDTAAIQAAMDAANLYQLKLQIPGTVNGYKITAPLIVNSLGMCIEGNGEYVTQLIASGNFSEILRFNSSTLYAAINGISFRSNSTTTRCVTVNYNATVIRFSKCLFSGSLTGDLVYSNGQMVDISESTFNLDSANTWAVNFDCYNQSCGVTDCRIGGTGNGIKISNLFSPADRVEGLRISNNYFINTSAYNIYIGNSLFVAITGNVLDQSSTAAIYISTAALNVIVDGNYVGTGTIGNPFGIYIHESSAGGHNISNNIIAYVNYGIYVNATVSARNTFISIIGNNFNGMGAACVVLDSVLSASIVGNLDNGFSPGGSWATKNTYGNGSYLFDNNCWSTNAIGLYHFGSYYRFGNDIGILGRNSGTATPAIAVNTFVISHGLFTTPKTVNFTIEGANLGAVWITAKNPTTFTANWVTVSTPIINWQAEV